MPRGKTEIGEGVAEDRLNDFQMDIFLFVSLSIYYLFTFSTCFP